jgi:hypothetical protein
MVWGMKLIMRTFQNFNIPTKEEFRRLDRTVAMLENRIRALELELQNLNDRLATTATISNFLGTVYVTDVGHRTIPLVLTRP